jgi:hypothetical protein
MTRVLNNAERLSIRRLVNRGGWTLKEIADRHGITAEEAWAVYLAPAAADPQPARVGQGGET